MRLLIFRNLPLFRAPVKRQTGERTGVTERYPAEYNEGVVHGVVNVGIRKLLQGEWADKLAGKVPLGYVTSLELHSGGDQELDGTMFSKQRRFNEC